MLRRYTWIGLELNRIIYGLVRPVHPMNSADAWFVLVLNLLLLCVFYKRSSGSRALKHAALVSAVGFLALALVAVTHRLGWESYYHSAPVQLQMMSWTFIFISRPLAKMNLNDS